MSNNRIYSGSRYEPRGRNADMSGMMVKRTPIFVHQQQAEKPDNSPFYNYNVKTGQSFISDSSQNTQAEERLNPQALRLLIKQEISKNQGPEDTNRKLIHTLQAQITDLKERISEYQKENNTKFQELTVLFRKEVKDEADKMGKEVQTQITSKLRLFFQQANSELTKDIMKTVEEDFLTINYGEDLQNRLDNINFRIDSLNKLMQSKNISSEELQAKMEKATLAENIEPKINKIEKEIENSKKHYQEILGRVKQVQEWMNQQKKRGVQNELGDKIENLKEKVKIFDQELQKKLGALEIQLTEKGGDINILKEKIGQLQKYNEEQRTLFLDMNKKLSSSIDVPSEMSTSILVNNSSGEDNKKGQNDTVTVNTDHLSQKREETKEDLKKSVYQVDNEGNLMDGEGKYLLTEEGTMIKLNQEQIEALIDSKAVEIIEH